jgi:solute carrier family 25 (mitochondrial carnitine/acylcarnitine transporter), member 20/29
MIRSEGGGALYRGLLSPILGFGLINATAFGVYGTVSTWIKNRNGPDKEFTTIQASFAGMCAGFAQSFVRSPVERIKTLCQTIKKPDGSKFYRGSMHCLFDTLRKEGPLGVSRGVWATVFREVPQYAIYYPAYELCKKMLTPKGGSTDNLSAPRLALAGGLAGTAQWLPPMYCIDVVKSRIQGAPSGTYKGIMDCARQIYHKEGYRSFFRGLTPALVRAFPLHGTIFAVYEITVKYLA